MCVFNNNNNNNKIPLFTKCKGDKSVHLKRSILPRTYI